MTDEESGKNNKQYQGNASGFYEKINEAYEMCMADEFLIQFDLKDYEAITYRELNDKGYKCIGRLLPPNITRIQQKFSSYLVREGVMAIPKKDLLEIYKLSGNSN